MKLALYIIFYGGILWGFWLTYEILKHYQGDKIKAYWKRQQEIYRAEKHYNEIQRQNKLRAYERSQPELVEVEDLGVKEWDLVKNGNRTPNQFILLDITNNKALDRFG